RVHYPTAVRNPKVSSVRVVAAFGRGVSAPAGGYRPAAKRQREKGRKRGQGVESLLPLSGEKLPTPFAPRVDGFLRDNGGSQGPWLRVARIRRTKGKKGTRAFRGTKFPDLLIPILLSSTSPPPRC